MRRSLTLAATVAAAIVPTALPTAASVARSAPRCEDRAGTTLAQSARTRAFSVPGRSPYRSVLVCATGSRRTVRIGNAGECMGTDEVGTVLAEGRYVAFTSTSCGLTSGTTSAGLVDTAKGRLVWRERGYAGAVPADGFSVSVRDLALTPAGTVAWLGGYDPQFTEVHLRTAATGASAVLDRADRTGAITDLALGAKRVYWTHDGVARSAGL